MYSSLLVGLAITIGAPAVKEPPTKTASVVGEWTGEKATEGGMELPVPEGGIAMIFTEDGKLIIREGNRDNKDAGTYKVDAKKDPAEIDLIPPAEKKGLMISGIYKIDGDTLMLAFTRGAPGDARPTKFESPAGSTVMLMTLKRAKK